MILPSIRMHIRAGEIGVVLDEDSDRVADSEGEGALGLVGRVQLAEALGVGLLAELGEAARLGLARRKQEQAPRSSRTRARLAVMRPSPFERFAGSLPLGGTRPATRRPPPGIPRPGWQSPSAAAGL